MRVVRERLDDVGARVHELAVQLRDELGMIEHDLGDERAGLEVAPPLELEEVALGADHRPRLQALQQPSLLCADLGHADLPSRVV